MDARDQTEKHHVVRGLRNGLYAVSIIWICLLAILLVVLFRGGWLVILGIFLVFCLICLALYIGIILVLMKFINLKETTVGDVEDISGDQLRPTFSYRKKANNSVRLRIGITKKDEDE